MYTYLWYNINKFFVKYKKKVFLTFFYLVAMP